MDNSFIALIIVILIQMIVFAYFFSQKKDEKYSVPDFPHVQAFVPAPDIFVSFACTNCHSSIVLDQRIFPGEVAVLDCVNCHVSWTVYNPQLIIKPTKELPEPIKVGVAKNSPIMNG
jgi:hypothetical protein